MFRQFAPLAQVALVNGEIGLFNAPDGRLQSVMGVTVVDGRITEMYILADPDRLAGLELPGASG